MPPRKPAPRFPPTISGLPPAPAGRTPDSDIPPRFSENSSGRRLSLFLLQGGFGRILPVMKRWYLYLIAGPLGLGALGVLVYFVGWNVSIPFADLWSRDPQPMNAQREVGKISKENAAPNDILRLRLKHQLRPLTEREEGTHIQDLPNGIYGFSMCKVAELRATRGNTYSLEIQKHDGIAFYVGYASDEEIERYLTHQKNFHVLMSLYPRKGAASLFDIPVEFISKCEERPAEDASLFDLYVTTIPELHL